jgi:hypothetical protein
MSDISFEVDRKTVEAVLERIEDDIEAGAKDGLDEVLEAGQDRARATVTTQRTPYTTPHLFSSFDTILHDRGGGELQGFITNPLEHAAYIDQGVSGTENQRDTPFGYTSGGPMPPLDEMIAFVEERFGGYDLGSSDGGSGGGPAPPGGDDSGGGGDGGDGDGDGGDNVNTGDVDEFYRSLGEYDLEDQPFVKGRKNTAAQFNRGELLLVDSGDGPRPVQVQSIEEQDGYVSVKPTFGDDAFRVALNDRTKNQVVARQEKTHVQNLREDQEVMFSGEASEEFLHNRVISGTIIAANDFNGNGEIDTYTIRDKREANKLYNDEEDAFFQVDADPLANTFLGTRNERPELWDQQITPAETPTNTTLKGKFRVAEPKPLTDGMIQQSFRDDSKLADDYVIKTGDGEIYSARVRTKSEIGRDANTFEFVAGFDEVTGERISFEFGELDGAVDRISGKTWDVVGIPENKNNWAALEEGDQLFANIDRTVNRLRDENKPTDWKSDRFTFDEPGDTRDDNAYARVVVDDISENEFGERVVTARTFGAANREFQLEPERLFNLKRNSAPWKAKG